MVCFRPFGRDKNYVKNCNSLRLIEFHDSSINSNTGPKIGMSLRVLDAVTRYWLRTEQYSLHHEKDPIMLSISGQKINITKNGHRFFSATAAQCISVSPFKYENSFIISSSKIFVSVLAEKYPAMLYLHCTTCANFPKPKGGLICSAPHSKELTETLQKD